jgi:hypothetical protein
MCDMKAVIAVRMKIVCMLAAILFLAGCATTYKVTKENSRSKKNTITPEEFFKQTAGDQWTITLLTGDKRKATIAEVPGDSVALVSDAGSLVISLYDIQSVSKTRYLEGMIVYPLMGTFGGFLIGINLGQVGSAHNFWVGYIGFVAGVAIGSVGGLALGIFNPPETIYDFSDSEHR